MLRYRLECLFTTTLLAGAADGGAAGAHRGGHGGRWRGAGHRVGHLHGRAWQILLAMSLNAISLQMLLDTS